MTTHVLTRHSATPGVSPVVDNDRLWREEELASRWQVSARTVQRLVGSGQLAGTHIGRSPRFSHAAVLAYETRNATLVSYVGGVAPDQDGLLVVKEPPSGSMH